MMNKQMFKSGSCNAGLLFIAISYHRCFEDYLFELSASESGDANDSTIDEIMDAKSPSDEASRLRWRPLELSNTYAA